MKGMSAMPSWNILDFTNIFFVIIVYLTPFFEQNCQYHNERGRWVIPLTPSREIKKGTTLKKARLFYFQTVKCFQDTLMRDHQFELKSCFSNFTYLYIITRSEVICIWFQKFRFPSPSSPPYFFLQIWLSCK